MRGTLQERLSSARGRHVGLAAGLLALGFALGGLTFGTRGCGEPDAARSASSTAHSHVDGDVGQVWTCAMHPQIRKDGPGPCPICGMDLIPVADAEAEEEQGAGDVLVLSERAKTLARVRTSEVRAQEDTAAALHLLGRVEPDETALKTVTAWTGGRVDELRVNVTGQRVRAGQVIATLYSPEVFAASQDLQVARRQVEQLAESPEPSRRSAASALRAARERLRLLGVPDAELQRLESQGRPTEAAPIRTPFAGTVIERMVDEGAYVQTGAPLFRIARLDTLWVQLDAYEQDLSSLARGQSVRVRVRALPGADFEGKITFIDPTLDPQRRTARVRVVVKNPDGQLRPGMFAEASVDVRVAGKSEAEGGPLLVPASAPLFTGERVLVYVERPGAERPTYEPRVVRLGPRLGDHYPVVAGLSEGERVVTQGAFVLDADLQIRGGPSLMAAPPPDPPLEVTDAQRRALAPVVERYLEVQRALAADQLDAAGDAARSLGVAVGRLRWKARTPAADAWAALAPALAAPAHQVAEARELPAARLEFEALSQAVASLLRRFGNPLSRSLGLAFCPMALGSEGARWVQADGEIDNAYFGPAMRTCGEIEQHVPAGAHLPAPAHVARPAAGGDGAEHRH